MLFPISLNFFRFFAFFLAIMALSNMGQVSVQCNPSSVQKCKNFKICFETCFSTKSFEKNHSVAMDKPHSWHVSEMYSDKYFTKYCENVGSVQHGSGLPYATQILVTTN